MALFFFCFFLNPTLKYEATGRQTETNVSMYPCSEIKSLAHVNLGENRWLTTTEGSILHDYDASLISHLSVS